MKPKIKAFLEDGKLQIRSEYKYKELDEILRSGILSGFRGYGEYHYGGEWVQKLETQFKAYFDVKHAVALNSATAGLESALRAYHVGSGDEVIVTPYSFSSSASCVNMVGAKPVFVDITEDTFCMHPAEVHKAITPKTKAIIPVHLCGHPAAVYAFTHLARVFNLKVIEDCAQAIGATAWDQKVGTFGDCGIFSFNQSKHINTGEGGMLITNDDEFARIVRAVRNHGEVADPDLKIVGHNYRLCEIEAMMASKQFEDIDNNLFHRNQLASYLTRLLSNVKGVTPPVVKDGYTHSWYTYSVKLNLGIPKKQVCEELAKRGVYFGEYVKPLHLLPIHGGEEGDLPVVERMWKEELIVTDTIRPDKTFEDMDKIAEAFREIANKVQ
jgi:dTDP-4-amino-4,6-dideoxygalactose transaminase